MKQPHARFRNIIELIETFPNEKDCVKHLADMKWKNGAKCPYCQHEKIYTFSNNIKYKCAACRRNFSVRVGTIFEDSKLSLRKWFIAIYLETAHKKGISSHQLSRDIGVTQKSAWHMLHRIRECLKNRKNYKMEGFVEADETVIGGLEKNKHLDKRTPHSQGRNTTKKTPVVGVLQRGSHVRVQVVKDVSRQSLHAFIRQHVWPHKSILFTDTWKGYNGLKVDYSHVRVNHSKGEYVKGFAWTNGIENFWSLLSRGIIGVYHHVSRKHLQRYCDGFVFRFNTRKMDEMFRFRLALENSHGTLPYKTLIEK